MHARARARAHTRPRRRRDTFHRLRCICTRSADSLSPYTPRSSPPARALVKRYSRPVQSSQTMGFLLSDALAVKNSLGQSRQVVQGPPIDPDGWKGPNWQMQQANKGITLDPTGRDQDLDAVRGDMAMAQAEGILMVEAEDEETRRLMEEYEAEMRAMKEQRKAAAAVQSTMRGKKVRDEKKEADEFEEQMRFMREQRAMNAAAANADTGMLVLETEDEEAQRLAAEYEAEMKALTEQRKAAAKCQAATRGKQTRDKRKQQ